MYLYTYSISICIFCCLFNYIHAFHLYCHANICYRILFIQSECFVQPFTNEGGCIVTETSDLLLKCGLVHTKES